MISYAQNFEDVMLWRALGHVENGFYVDIGAQDPVIDSVSLGFHELGWRGVHVEPTPAYAEALRSARPDETVVQAAIGERDGLIPFFEIAGTGISTGDAAIAERHAASGYAHKRIDVPCIRLAALFDHLGARDIHWMKIDVEGMEASVLRSWAPSPVRPWVVVVESTLPLSTELSHADWEPVIVELGYAFAYFDGLNRFYVSSAHRPLLKAFEAPPNVYDGFVLAGSSSHAFCAKLNGDIAQAKDTVAVLEGRSHDLEQALQAGLQTGEAQARMIELEREVAGQHAVAAALAEVERAKDETVQLLRSVGAAQESRAAQIVSAQDQALHLQAALIERERSLADLRSQLATAQASLAQHYVEHARSQRAATARSAEREQAIDAERAGWVESHRLQAQHELAVRLAEQEQRHRQVLASAEASAVRFEARLAEQRARFDAEAAATATARDLQLLHVQRESRAGLAEQELGFRELLGRAQDDAAQLRADLGGQVQRFEQKRERAEADAAGLRADLAAQRQAASAALEAARNETLDLQSQLADQKHGFGAHIANARADVAQLQTRLLEQRHDFSVRLDAAREASQASEALTAQRELQARLGAQEQAFLQHLAEQRRGFDADLAAARTDVDASKARDAQLEMQRRLAAQESRFDARLATAHADATKLQLRLAALQQAVAAELAGLRRKPLERLREALGRSTASASAKSGPDAFVAPAPVAAEPVAIAPVAAVPAAVAPAPAVPAPSTALPAAPVAAPPVAPLEADLLAVLGEPDRSRVRSVDLVVRGAADLAPFGRPGFGPAAVAEAGHLLHEPEAEIHVLNDLLVLNGVSFVRAAYRTVLRREPDADGERNYATLLRAGLDKLVLLDDMARSDEGREAGAVVPGLARALRRRRLARIPLVGPLLLGLGALFRRGGDHDPTRAFQSQLIDLQRSTLELAYQAHASMRDLGQQQRDDLHATVQHLRQQQAQVEQLVRRVGDRQDDAERSLAGRHDALIASVAKPLTDFVTRLEASVDELRQQHGRLEAAVGRLSERQDDIGASVATAVARMGKGDADANVQAQLLRKAAAWKA